jgi:hypothetical protein
MTKQQGKPLVSGSGLTPGDRKLLADCLAQIDLILETPHLMGAHEADQGFALQRRLKSRLTPEAQPHSPAMPPTPSDCLARASRVIGNSSKPMRKPGQHTTPQMPRDERLAMQTLRQNWKLRSKSGKLLS